MLLGEITLAQAISPMPS